MNKPPSSGLPRFAEVGIAVCGLLVASPILVFFAFLIKLESSGPILFRQKRVGLNGKEFTLFKLRTMRVTRVGALLTATQDPRVTPIGRILRRTKIDELPELWNVCIGDMRIVGPRPEIPQFVDLNDPIWCEILTSRPGITDPVTLRLRNEEHLLAKVIDKQKFYTEIVQPYKLRGSVRYLRNRSWKSDIRIICRTLKAIILPRTASAPSKEEMQLSFAE